jgi:BTB/POZ domain
MATVAKSRHGCPTRPLVRDKSRRQRPSKGRISDFAFSRNIHLINQMSRTDRIGYWRSDAAASFSDFVIVVREEDSEEDSATKKDEDSSAEDTTTKTYHVHRCHLCCGPRYSEYFRRLFNNDFHETKEARASFKFSPGMARDFPAFLDYLYGGPATSIVFYQPWNLGKLAEYFGVEPLLKDTIPRSALQMFSMTAVEFNERSESMSSALLVRIMKEVMALAKTREETVWSNCGRCPPGSSIKMV